MKITFIKGSHCYNHVRVLKFINYFKHKKINYDFICWLRDDSYRSPAGDEEYIFFGGGFGSKKLALFYPLWMLKLFFHMLFKKVDKGHVFFAIDFDSACPVFFASLIRPDIKYIYDIHDDFSKRYKFPKVIKKIIERIDFYVRRRALKTIHVDENRVSSLDDNFIIIYNSPEDYFDKKHIVPSLSENKTFCVSGLLSSIRGLESIYSFALSNNKNRFIVAGSIGDSIAEKFISLENVDYLGIVDQKSLFEKIKSCHAIFSLYDPSLEINRLAASNKLYDAIMLGVPVIVNRGLLVSNYVEEKSIGFVVDYNYNSAWNDLANSDNSVFNMMGLRGRKIYESDFSYKINFEEKMDLLLGLEN